MLPWIIFLLSILAILVVAFVLDFWNTKIGAQIYEFGVQVSRLTNFALGGSPDETLSFRVAKENGECGFCTFICKILDTIHPDHCKDTLELDEVPAHRPIWTWLLFWAVVAFFLIYRPFGVW